MYTISKPVAFFTALLTPIKFHRNNPRTLYASAKTCTRFLKLQTIIFHGASRIQWIPCCDGARPPGAVEGGYDSATKTRMFIIRAHHKGGLYPGILNTTQEKATIAVYGREHQLQTYEVLVAPYTSVSWMPGSPTEIRPPNAIIGGVSDSGETLFIGRALHHGMWSIGKIHGSHETCYIPWKGNVFGYKNFEILVQNQNDLLNNCNDSELD